MTASPALDHEALGAEPSLLTQKFGNRALPENPGRLVVTYTPVFDESADNTYVVTFDATAYPQAAGATEKPVFSLYNLGLQSWKHDAKITAISYFEDNGLPVAAPAAADLVKFAVNFPTNTTWSTKLPTLTRTGKEPAVKPGPKTNDIPLEKNICFMQSPTYRILKIEIVVSGCKLVGPLMTKAEVTVMETSHGDVPPPPLPGANEE